MGMPTEINGPPQRGEKDLAVRTSAKMEANLSADITRQFIIEVGRKAPEDFQTLGFGMSV